MKNLKDTMSTICGLIIAICTAILTAGSSGLTLPTWLMTACGIAVAVAGAVLGVITGRNADLTKKTPSQISAAMKPK